MCAVLTSTACRSSASSYYEWAAKKPTKQHLRDEQLTAVIAAFRDRNKLNAGLGSHKTWIRLRGEGQDIARCTVERLMRANGWEGANTRPHWLTRRIRAHWTWSTATSPRPRRTSCG